MKPVRYFLIFGICVITVVVLAQSAFGATRAAAAKPMAHVAAFQPMKHSAKIASPARVRVQATALGRMRVQGISTSPGELRR
jgi:hypothetical protein